MFLTSDEKASLPQCGLIKKTKNDLSINTYKHNLVLNMNYDTITGQAPLQMWL